MDNKSSNEKEKPLEQHDKENKALEDSTDQEQIKQTDDIELPESEDTENSQKENETKEPGEEIDKKCSRLDKLEENIKALFKRTDYLRKDINRILNLLDQMTNNSSEIERFIDKFIKIFSSEKDQTPVTINAELKQTIIEFMEEKYNIVDNPDKAINTALLVALYKSENN